MKTVRTFDTTFENVEWINFEGAFAHIEYKDTITGILVPKNVRISSIMEIY